jgi:lysophospholipid acyltransferase (LPLAT)-like uncharacterized protein
MGHANQHISGKSGRGGYLQAIVSARGFDVLVQAVPAIAPPVLRALLSTCSLRIHNRKIWEQFVIPQRAYIGLVWHQNFLFVVDCFRHQKIVAMVSRSKDGEIVSRTMHRLGYRTARGSSSAGGGGALLEVTKLLREGWTAAMVADGPRGPARSSKLGPVIASKESGVPMIPVTVHAAPAWYLRNWDRTMIPKPFSRIVLGFGEPMTVPADATREECERWRETVDARMAELEATCRPPSGVS